MKKTNNQSVSQLSSEISSIDIQAMFLERAKNAILATAVELMEQDMARPRSRREKKIEAWLPRNYLDQVALLQVAR